MKIFSSIQTGKFDNVCQKCMYFQNDPVLIEEAYPGLRVMSSGFASVRDHDGFCSYNQLYLSAWDRCSSFSQRTHEVNQENLF
jgi:hypothetical protein